MSHDVDLELTEVDVTLSFTMPGRLVYLFAYRKGSADGAERELPMFTREDWEKMTAVVRRNLTSDQPDPTPSPRTHTEPSRTD